jgi:hypothetical protein
MRKLLRGWCRREGEARPEVPAPRQLTTKLSRGPRSSCDRDRPARWMDLLIEGSTPSPGRHVTDHQMRLYMTFRRTDGPAIAAAKASISLATAYRFEQDHRPPAINKVRTRRRPDPLAGFFDAEVIPMLKATPGLRAVAIFEEMFGLVVGSMTTLPCGCKHRTNEMPPNRHNLENEKYSLFKLMLSASAITITRGES